MGYAQKSRHYEVLQRRSEKIDNKTLLSQESLKVLFPSRTTVKQLSTKTLFSANACKGYIAVVGFHLSAAMVGIALAVLTLWVMGYAVLSFSSR